MKKKYLQFLLASLTFLLTAQIPVISHANEVTPFSQIVFFGDSLSDNGNFYSDVFSYMPKSPPYFQGRFSNGQVWSEYAAQYYLDKNSVTSVNYAIGGQTAIFHNPVKGYQPYTLSISRIDYLVRTMMSDRSSTLFVIWVGANDYLPGIDNVDQVTSDVIESIKYTIENLIYHGGTNFLVINLPDLAKTPYGRASTYQSALQAATLMHNLKLETAVTGIQQDYQMVNIHLFNINALVSDFTENLEAANDRYQTHIKVIDSSCWQGGYTLREKLVTEELMTEQIEDHLRNRSRSLMSSNDSSNKLDAAGLAHYIATTPDLMESYKVSENTTTGLKPCDNPDDFIFWDRVHPTAVMHQLIAKKIIAFMDQNYQPAPPSGGSNNTLKAAAR
jgi:phospholipase/lecithinase/hemolysin